MKITEVRVEYGRTVSDQQYGSERASVGLTSTVAEGEDWKQLFQELAEEATAAAIARLKQSTNEQVKQAVETPEEKEARWDREREAARERARLREERLRQQEAPGEEEEDDAERPF